MSREVQVRFCESRGVRFPRHSPVVHCKSLAQARFVLDRLRCRMEQVGVSLHPEKTRIVYCKDGKRSGSHEHAEFTFLGFTFRARGVRARNGNVFTGFVPVASGIGCKSDRRGSGFMVMLGGSADSFGAVGVGAGGDGAWPQLGGWFEE